MAAFPDKFDEFQSALEANGLTFFGALEIDESVCAKGMEKLIGQKAVLVGNAGPSMWNVFSKSNEFADGNADPMNRWTRRVIDTLALEYGAKAVYPFDEPYWPFQRIATKASGVNHSPLGVLVHPEYGLWYAFRGLIVLNENQELTSRIKELSHSFDTLIHPCDVCDDKPCLASCPVGAFSRKALNTKLCFEHLDSNLQPHCSQLGCLARGACPVGNGYKYGADQIKFHMAAYRGQP